MIPLWLGLQLPQFAPKNRPLEKGSIPIGNPPFLGGLCPVSFRVPGTLPETNITNIPPVQKENNHRLKSALVGDIY